MQRELKEEEEEEVLLLLIKFLHSFFSDSLAVGAAAAIELHHQLLLLHRKCVCLLSAELNLSVQHISTFSYLTIERRCCFANDCFWKQKIFVQFLSWSKELEWLELILLSALSLSFSRLDWINFKLSLFLQEDDDVYNRIRFGDQAKRSFRQTE